MEGDSGQEVGTSTEISLNRESACALGKQQDSVFDGKDLRLGFVDKDEDNKDNDEEKKTQQKDKLADLAGEEMSREDIEALPEEIKKLIEQGKFSGLYINCSVGDENGQASSLAMTTFLNYVVKNSDKPHDKLLREAYNKAESVVQEKYKDKELDFSVALVENDGKVSAISTGKNVVVIYDNDGNKKKIINASDQEIVQESEIKAGDKIILCSENASERLGEKVKTTDSVENIVKGLLEISESSSADKAEEAEIFLPQEPEENADTSEDEINLRSDEDSRKQLHSRIILSDKIVSLEDVYKGFGGNAESNIKYGNDFINGVLDDKELVETLDKRVETDPRFKGKQFSKGLMRKILAIEYLNDIVRNNSYYSRDKLTDIFYGYYQRKSPINTGQSGINENITLSNILDYIKATEIREYNKGRKGLTTASRRQVQPAVTEAVDTTISPTGDFEDLMEKPDDGVYKEKENYQLDRTIYQVIKRQLVPKKTILRWEALKQGLLKGSKDEQVKIMIKEQYAWDERIRDVLRFSRPEHVNRVDTENRELYEQCQALLKGFGSQGFLAVVEDDAIKIDETADLENLSEEQKKELFAEVLKEDGFRINRIKKRIGDREINTGEIRHRAFKISNHVISRRLSSEDILEEVEGIHIKIWTQDTSEEGPEKDKAKPPIEVSPPKEEAEAEIPVSEPGEDKPAEELEGAPSSPEHETKEPEQEEDKPAEKPEGASTSDEPLDREDLETEFNLGAAALPNHLSQDILQKADHLFAEDVSNSEKGWWYRARDGVLGGLYNIPILGGAVRGLAHPVQLIWQQGLARSIFEQQWIRFTGDVEHIVKAQDSSIPIEVSPELLDKSLQEGRNIRRSQNIFRRAVWGASDFAKGILGVSQTSEQKLAKQWLEQEMSKPQGERDSNLTEVQAKTLAEQDELGKRYANVNEELVLAESNKFVISQEQGETRHDLADNKELADQVNTRIKQIIDDYCEDRISREDLVRKMNDYLQNDFRDALSTYPALQEEFTAPEVASNILSIADKVKENWEKYNKGEEGKTKWDELRVNILFGRSEWGGVRGNKEMGFFQDRLARRLAERGFASSSTSGACALAKDFITNAAFFAGGYGLSVLGFGARTPLKLLGGFVGIGVGAGFKETGIGLSSLGIKGIQGRALKEVIQTSREAARGRGSSSGSRIRPEIEERLLVQRTLVNQAADEIEKRISVESLSEAQAQGLIVMLAEIRAKMRLTDLSGEREMNFKTQNYFEFTEGNENQEYGRLRGVFQEGLVKIINSGHNDLYDKFDDYTDLVEAQLRFTSADDRRIRRFLSREHNLSDDDVTKLYSLTGIDRGIERDNSTREMERRVRWYSIKKGASTMAKAAVTGLAVPVVYGIPANIVEEGMDLAQEGLAQYSQDWGEVLKGDVPVDVVGGSPVVDLSSIQKGVLGAKSYFEVPHWPPGQLPLHHQQIDGVDVQMSPFIRHGQVAGGGDYLVDVRNGTLYDLTNSHFETDDINHDGNLDLVLIDDVTGLKHNVNGMWGGQMKVEEGVPAVASRQETILAQSGTHQSSIAGHETNIPDGTQWVKDGQGKWDLVVQNPPQGQTIVLIDNARFDSSGQMQYDTIDPQLTLNKASLGINQALQTKIITGSQAEQQLGQLEAPVNKVFWTNNTDFSDKQELQFYDRVAVNDEGHQYIVLEADRMTGTASVGAEVIDVNNELSAHGAQFAFKVGGHDNPIIIDANKGNQLHLDFDSDDLVRSNGNTVTYQGHDLTLGEFSKMVVNKQELSNLNANVGSLETEYYGNEQVFNLAANGKDGYISVVYTGNDGTTNYLATITGTNGIGITEDTPIDDGFDLTLKQDLTRTIEKETPTFELHVQPLTIRYPWIPIPIRENIEKSVKRKLGDAIATQQASPTTTQQPKQSIDEKEIEVNIDKNEYLEFKEKIAKEIDEDRNKVSNGEMIDKDFVSKWGIEYEAVTKENMVEILTLLYSRAYVNKPETKKKIREKYENMLDAKDGDLRKKGSKFVKEMKDNKDFIHRLYSKYQENPSSDELKEFVTNEFKKRNITEITPDEFLEYEALRDLEVMLNVDYNNRVKKQIGEWESEMKVSEEQEIPEESEPLIETEVQLDMDKDEYLRFRPVKKKEIMEDKEKVESGRKGAMTAEVFERKWGIRHETLTDENLSNLLIEYYTWTSMNNDETKKKIEEGINSTLSEEDRDVKEKVDRFLKKMEDSKDFREKFVKKFMGNASNKELKEFLTKEFEKRGITEITPDEYLRYYFDIDHMKSLFITNYFRRVKKQIKAWENGIEASEESEES